MNRTEVSVLLRLFIIKITYTLYSKAWWRQPKYFFLANLTLFFNVIIDMIIINSRYDRYNQHHKLKYTFILFYYMYVIQF